MAPDLPKDADTYSEEETVARREAALKVMLTTPHKPHKATVEERKRGGGKPRSVRP